MIYTKQKTWHNTMSQFLFQCSFDCPYITRGPLYINTPICEYNPNHVQHTFCAGLYDVRNTLKTCFSTLHSTFLHFFVTLPPVGLWLLLLCICYNLHCNHLLWYDRIPIPGVTVSKQCLQCLTQCLRQSRIIQFKLKCMHTTNTY